MKKDVSIKYPDSFVSPHILADAPESSPVLLALSGGKDSRVLLHLLSEDSKAHGYKLHVAHFNHMIRGEEAIRDARFCEDLAKEYGVPFHLCKEDIPALSLESGNSLEMEGRYRRYRFFEKVMTENAIPILATAHHSRDNLETVLLHMLRGTGINGMSGIAPCRTFGKNLCLVRPILRMNVEEIDRICNNLNLEYVIDSTNSDTAYLRNAIRKNVAEPLIEMSPNVCEAVSRFSEIALEENSFISSMAQEFISKECHEDGQIPLESFNSIHKAVKSRVLSKLFEEISGATLERVHVLNLIELCEKAHPHSSLSLPNRFSAIIEGGELVFKENSQKIQENDYRLNFSEGTFDLSNGLVLKITKDSEQSAPQKNLHSIDIKESCISCENAYFRPKADGDVILHNGMSKKIKKLYNEKKLPLDIRNSLPLLVLDGNIAWIPTVAESDILKDAKRKDGESFYRISIENRK